MPTYTGLSTFLGGNCKGWGSFITPISVRQSNHWGVKKIGRPNPGGEWHVGRGVNYLGSEARAEVREKERMSPNVRGRNLNASRGKVSLIGGVLDGGSMKDGGVARGLPKSGGGDFLVSWSRFV